MKKPQKPRESSYVPYDIEAGVDEWDKGPQGGETCRVDELSKIFAWQRGFVNGWYGWANDGKGTMLDFLQVLKAKFDGHKICSFRQEDMDSVIEIVDGKRRAKIKAQRIYKNLAWTMTGKPWNKHWAAKHRCQKMSLEEEMEALQFILKHFFIINPKDRRYKNITDEMMFMYEKHGIDQFNIDPFNSVILPNEDRGDERLVKVFIDIKEFALETNSVFNIVNHPRSMTDVKDGKGKDAPYKIVTSFMQLGGSAWNMKMDAEFSIYRPWRHKDLNEPSVVFFNLKQRNQEVVGVQRGEYDKITFDNLRRQYYFDGICPMDGTMTKKKAEETAKQETLFGSKPIVATGTDDMPF